jgi:hypothetical protein
MSAPLLARVLLTALAAGQGVAPLFLDLNRTHATNPLWPGHARFHVVWQTVTQTLGAAIVVALIWWPGEALSQRFYLAAILTAIPMASFFAAMASRTLYAGTLHDPNGIPPVRVRTRRGVIEFNMNAAVVIVGSALLIVAVVIF